MFRDRKDAGEKLAQALMKYENQGVIVIGIPRGGVEVAYHVAHALNADLSMIISRKLGHPENPELAIGAIAEDGSLYLSDLAESVSQGDLYKVLSAEREEIRRRIQELRDGRPLPDLANKVVVLVDDGIATGATIYATIKLCRNQKAAKVIVAAPVSSSQSMDRLRKLVDEVCILEIPEMYWAVSQVYKSFTNLEDSEVKNIMKKWEMEHVHEIRS
ncbi:MAG: phosphoribosyltransferase [Bacteroidetes bacterium]|nr:phosphoribosyltransferase [Bacteroidota bacterium]